MNERPILFSAPMVRAILDGRKTQTRRIAKLNASGRVARGGRNWHCEDPAAIIACPYGSASDCLWVRETWAHYQTIDPRKTPDGRSFSEVSDGLAGYRADGHESIEGFRRHVRLMGGSDAVEINGDRWRPSIHMPRWASRITLEITAVRVERLQAISEADAKAEGVEPWVVGDGFWRDYGLTADQEEVGAPPLPSARDSFRSLWESINGAGSWAANPWVWVVEFRSIKP